VSIPNFVGAKGVMEVVATTGAIRRAKLQSNRYHQQTNTQLNSQFVAINCSAFILFNLW